MKIFVNPVARERRGQYLTCYNTNTIMKLGILIILIGILAVFFGLSLVAPNDISVETVQTEQETEEIQVFQEEEAVVIQEIVEEVEEETVVEDLSIQPEEEETEVVAEIPDEVIVEPVEVVAPPVVVEEVPQVSFSTINEVTREALVNIFCTTKSGGSFKPITGSGILIDERGVIITNAHVAQYYLLKDYLTEDFITCVIRTGSPARPLYAARLLFISPSWVQTNANGIIQQEPKGTGEDDYALLLITGRTDATKSLPESFNFVEPLYNSGNIKKADDVLLAAYPAGFLSGISISKDLYINSAVTKVMELFTFKTGTLDLFSIGGTVVAQQGSSGGAVVDRDNKLLGIIVTSTMADSTGERDLRAISIAHINRSFVKDTGFDLQTLLSGDIQAEADVFNENIAPSLTQLLVNELEK